MTLVDIDQLCHRLGEPVRQMIEERPVAEVAKRVALHRLDMERQCVAWYSPGDMDRAVDRVAVVALASHRLEEGRPRRFRSARPAGAGIFCLDLEYLAVLDVQDRRQMA